MEIENNINSVFSKVTKDDEYDRFVERDETINGFSNWGVHINHVITLCVLFSFDPVQHCNLKLRGTYVVKPCC